MTQGDIQSFLLWWFWLFVCGVTFLPITTRIFASFFDKGYLFAKVLSLTTTSFLVFLLGIFHIAPFTHLTVILVLGFLLAVNIVYWKRDQTKADLRIFIGEEVLFFVLLFIWAQVRSFQPDLFGLEKYMDFGFVNTILRSEYFPPKDMWYTPLPINYYYFGHLTTAVLTRLTEISSTITYNLMLATLFAFTFALSFSLTANLVKTVIFTKKTVRISRVTSVAAGLLGGFLVACGGNLHTLYAFFTAYPNENPVPFWQLTFAPFSFPNSYWYPNATRFIYHTIHEFPIYSFIVSDLHGHVLDIPNVLLFLALTFIFITQDAFKKISKHTLFFLLFQGFLLAIMYMTNAWDSLIYMGLWILIVGIFLRENWKQMSLVIGIPFATFFVLSRPFSHFFKVDELVSGIGVLCAPTFLTNMGKFGPFLFEVDHCQHSPLYQLFMLWGIPFILFIALYLFLRKQKQEHATDVFAFCLFLCGFFLVLIPEFFYMKDIYPAHYRANTMFKLTYQAFMMFGIAGAYTIFRIGHVLSKKYLLYFVIGITLLLTPSILYPYLAVPAFYNNFSVPMGLYGLGYLQKDYPGDYAAIQWLNDNVSGQPVILEAQGDSYTNYARVSVNTGLPTVLGWTVHEWLWRGSYNPLPPRMQEIQNLYETTDLTTAKSIITKYDVRLIYIGDLERKKYPRLSVDKFYQLGTLIYAAQGVQIFSINH